MQYETSRVAIEACLRDLIMTDAKDTRAPKEIYGGPSKEAWRAGIRTTWTETWPEDDILAIRFHDTSWELRQEIVWENGAWHKVDMKYLYAKVIVDSGDGLATMYIAVVNVDQTRGGAVSYGVHTKKSGFKIEYMLKKNL